MVILDKNPLESARKYMNSHMVITDGAVIDRDVLPIEPMLTAPMDPPEPEQSLLVPTLSTSRFPICPMCMWHQSHRQQPHQEESWQRSPTSTYSPPRFAT